MLICLVRFSPKQRLHYKLVSFRVCQKQLQEAYTVTRVEVPNFDIPLDQVSDVLSCFFESLDLEDSLRFFTDGTFQAFQPAFENRYSGGLDSFSKNV